MSQSTKPTRKARRTLKPPRHASLALKPALGRRRTQKFPFERLPVELRLKIWQLTVEPRHVVLWKASEYSEYFYFRCTSFPVALHVCRESRNELLRQYTPISLSREPNIDKLIQGRKRRGMYSFNTRKHYINYVNFSVDTVVFPNDHDLFKASKALPDKFQLIQSIVICSDIYDEIQSETIYRLRKLPNLKGIYIKVSGEAELRFQLYDPSAEYELSLDGAPLGYSWKSLFASYRGLIAKHWEQAPLKGLVASQRPCLYSVVPGVNTLYCGLYRNWMV